MKIKNKDPKYLNDNNLWDSSWLREKYPNRFEEYYNTDEGIEHDRALQYQKMYGENYSIDIIDKKSYQKQQP